TENRELRAAFLGKVHQIAREGSAGEGRAAGYVTHSHQQNARIRIGINPHHLACERSKGMANGDRWEVMSNSYASGDRSNIKLRKFLQVVGHHAFDGDELDHQFFAQRHLCRKAADVAAYSSRQNAV